MSFLLQYYHWKNHIQCYGRSSIHVLSNYEVSLDHGNINIIKGDKEGSRKCYQANLRIKKVVNATLLKSKTHNVNFVDLDSRKEYEEDKLVPTRI